MRLNHPLFRSSAFQATFFFWKRQHACVVRLNSLSDLILEEASLLEWEGKKENKAISLDSSLLLFFALVWLIWICRFVYFLRVRIKKKKKKSNLLTVCNQVIIVRARKELISLHVLRHSSFSVSSFYFTFCLDAQKCMGDIIKLVIHPANLTANRTEREQTKECRNQSEIRCKRATTLNRICKFEKIISKVTRTVCAHNLIYYTFHSMADRKNDSGLAIVLIPSASDRLLVWGDANAHLLQMASEVAAYFRHCLSELSDLFAHLRFTVFSSSVDEQSGTLQIA